MKKNLKILIFTLIFSIIMPIVNFAVNEPSLDNSNFFYSDKSIVAPGDVITLTIDLSKINYDEFEFSLKSSESLDNINTDENMQIIKNDNSLKIVSSKTNLNMNKIELYYKIPEDMKIGSSIVFSGSITKIAESSEDSNDVANNSTNDISQVDITINISNDDQNDENNEMPKIYDNENNDDIEKQENIKEKSTILTQSASSTSMITQISSKVISTSMSSGGTDKETVSYNGSNNNYLTSLSVNNYNFNTTFSKTNMTYFISVESDISSVDINAIAEDDDATISVYGNTNLKSGRNKILISVTAKNGDVRVYRIFATK